MATNKASLVLILPSLPASVNCKTIRRIVRDGLADCGYGSLARLLAVTRCTVLTVTDPANGRREYHGFVQVKPAKAAMDVIEALSGKELCGRQIIVRRYQQRSGSGSELGAPALRSERRRRDLKLDIFDI